MLNQSVTVVMVSEEEWDRSNHLEYGFVPYFTGYESYIVTQCGASLTWSIGLLVLSPLCRVVRAAETKKDAGLRKDTDLLRMATSTARLR